MITAPLLNLDENRIKVVPDYAQALESNGWSTLDAVFAFSCKNEVNNHPTRPVYRIELPGSGVFYLKRYSHPKLKNSIKPLLNGSGPQSMAAREWSAMQALLSAGLGTMIPVAYGEEFSLGFEKRSFLLTAEVPNLVPLNEWVETQRHEMESGPFHDLKLKLLNDVADLTAKMHQAGIIHGDYYTKHIMVQAQAADYVLYLLDLQRASVGRKPSKTDVARELAGLLASTKLSVISPTDRVRFYLRYQQLQTLRSKDRRIINKIQRRLKKLLDRKKFKVFQDETVQVQWRRA